MKKLFHLTEKRNLLLEALAETRVDFSSPEACIVAVARNTTRFEKLKALEEILVQETLQETEWEKKMEEEILIVLLQLQENMERLIRRLKTEKRIATESMTDFARIKSIASSYVKTAQGPVFVDRDFE